MKKNLVKLLLGTSCFFLIMPFMVSADAAVQSSSPQKAKDLLNTVGTTAGYAQAANSAAGDALLSTLVGTIISTALGVLGMVFVILMIYAGYNWLTAAGDEAKVTKAKDTIWRAIIGLIIVVSAYAIWSFVLGVL